MILLHMSISGGVLILLTVAVRFLAAKKLPKRTFVMLWGITALRLLIPFDLPLHYGISSPVTRAADRAVRSVRAVSEPVTGVFDWKTAVWLAGAGAAILIFSIRYYRERQRLSDALPVSEDAEEILRMLVRIPGRVRILVSDRTTTPLTAGIVFPRIILPKLLKADRGTDFKYVLMHEMIHIRRAEKKEQANAEDIAVEEGDASYTGQLKSEEGAPEVVVEVNDEMTDKYHVETDQTENGEITVSVFSQAGGTDE